MSATFPNIDELGEWLSANVYSTDKRPIPLDKFVVKGGSKEEGGDRWRLPREGEGEKLDHTNPTLYTNHRPIPKDPDGITELCLESIRKCGQVGT